MTVHRPDTRGCLRHLLNNPRACAAPASLLEPPPPTTAQGPSISLQAGALEPQTNLTAPVKALVWSLDNERGRISLNTRKLEKEPGDMLRDRQLVFDGAEAMAQAWRERVGAVL